MFITAKHDTELDSTRYCQRWRMMTEANEKKPLLLLKKWLLLELALNDKRLSKGDCAVNWQILDRYNPDKGVAYPSMKRLATDTGFTPRNIQRSVTRLVKADYVAIIQHGNQSRSNRYRPNFSLLDRVETATSLQNEGVETATSKGRDVEVPNVETATSLEPIYEPAYERGVNEIGKKSNDFFDATPPLPLTGATLASKEQKAKYQFQDFWAIYPKQMNVSKAETEITEALNDGALLGDILDGARRYAVYVKHQGWCGDHQYIALPHNWIKGKRWLDSWKYHQKAKSKLNLKLKHNQPKKTPLKTRHALQSQKLRQPIRQRNKRLLMSLINNVESAKKTTLNVARQFMRMVARPVKKIWNCTTV